MQSDSTPLDSSTALHFGVASLTNALIHSYDVSTNLSYSPAELKEVVAFAKSYGVRIQPEWDMPGHGSWGFGMPELVSSACSSALGVTRPELYTFMKKFLGEMADIFEEIPISRWRRTCN